MVQPRTKPSICVKTAVLYTREQFSPAFSGLCLLWYPQVYQYVVLEKKTSPVLWKIRTFRRVPCSLRFQSCPLTRLSQPWKLNNNTCQCTSTHKPVIKTFPVQPSFCRTQVFDAPQLLPFCVTKFPLKLRYNTGIVFLNAKNARQTC